MRTITEFAAITLKNAAQARADLAAAGKTAEELPAALGEALKLEGDKLNYLIHALEAAGDRTNDLKRVIVSALAEGEKAPSQSKQIGEQVYTVEYYVALNRAKPEESRDRGGRGDKRGGKRGDRRGGGRGEGRGGDREGGRGPRGPRKDAAPGAAAGPRPPLPKPKA